MAPIMYTIVVKNNSGSTQGYLLFNQPPTLTDEQAYPVVWMQPAEVPSGGMAGWDISMDCFAVCGRSPVPLATEVRLDMNNATPVALASWDGGLGTVPQLVISDANKCNPVFMTPYGTTQKPGCFGINAQPWDTSICTGSFWCGLGRYDEYQNPVPVACFATQPNTMYMLMPKSVCYVVRDVPYPKGMVVDVLATFNPEAVETIDFSGEPPGTIATLVYKSDGTTDVSLSQPQ